LSEPLSKVNLSSRIHTGGSREAISNVELQGKSILSMRGCVVSLRHLGSKKFLTELQQFLSNSFAYVLWQEVDTQEFPSNPTATDIRKSNESLALKCYTKPIITFP
jgi:hypothetical protein